MFRRMFRGSSQLEIEEIFSTFTATACFGAYVLNVSAVVCVPFIGEPSHCLCGISSSVSEALFTTFHMQKTQDGFLVVTALQNKVFPRVNA